MEKVYCKHCKHKFSIPDLHDGLTDLCGMNYVKSVTYLESRKCYALCRDINKSNDCKEYERRKTILEKIREYFKKHGRGE